ncbi:hypothetical protein CH272_02635 [Rhodococcus sp. 05-340-1]|uniref:hypothetical protein n=2 Tax=unclassified Rhodococcus (in: high G+C Gram-positive bacteria) TaxID=192944 RepID=UPI000B9B4903|nr:hypothetical protein [Rhodococcus sp. 05-340-2]OZD69942.1 hypothetical protein CH271_07930 [Rhodococcus sp. 05-340-2]OZD83318.1 hypothetical protein CH272_02635 [Rhodococcus sp. 05-340-1]
MRIGSYILLPVGGILLLMSLLLQWDVLTPAQATIYTGVGVLTGGSLAYLASWQSRQQSSSHFAKTQLDSERHFAQAQKDRENSEAVERCWDRFVWAVERENTLDPEVFVGLLERLADQSQELDKALAELIEDYHLTYLEAAELRLSSSRDEGNEDK